MSEPHYADDAVTLYAGDCLAVLPTLPDNSVDAVVTDPPYGLEFMGKEWDGPKLWREYVTDADKGYVSDGRTAPKFQTSRPTYAAGLPFQRWCQLWAAECLRVLRPGGHLLAFGGTRTYHRLAVGIEDAGFELRDSCLDINGHPYHNCHNPDCDPLLGVPGLAWLYGSGFPKSLDVSKAIDRAAGAEREIIGQHPHITPRRSSPHAQTAGNYRWGSEWMPWDELPDQARDWYEAAGAKKGQITAPATADAQRWQGWGTALKPAHEPIVVARKPLVGTVAANVLAYGTGALNVDGCRIGEGGQLKWSTPRGMGSPNSFADDAWTQAQGRPPADPTANPAGRWPANVALDETAAAALDQMSGESAGKGGTTAGWQDEYVGGKYVPIPKTAYEDIGGASRFFYTAKAGSDERITHREPMCVCGHSRSQHADDEWGSCLIPGCWCPGFAIDRSTVKTTSHPTVKPLSLMRWLVLLVTPPGGVILEPFAGSGTTVEAAILEGFRCIAIEREADYLPLITQRINRRRDPIAYLTAAGEDLGLFDEDAS